MNRALIICAVSAGLVVPSLAGDRASGSLRGLLTEYRCDIVDRLERIHTVVDPSSLDNRFIVVVLPTHPHGFVQCLFDDDGTRMLCEASSGYYYDLPDTPRTFHLDPTSIAALARLGFDTDDSKGNFVAEFAIGHEPDFNAVADLILTALHDGYGARPGDRLDVTAPLAPRPGSRCAPVS